MSSVWWDEEWKDELGTDHRAVVSGSPADGVPHVVLVESLTRDIWQPRLGNDSGTVVFAELQRRGEEIEKAAAHAKLLAREIRVLTSNKVDGEAIGRGIVRELFQLTDPARPRGLMMDWVTALGKAIGRGMRP